MKHKIGLYLYGAGLLLLIIQFLVLVFGYVNNDMTVTEQFVIVEEEEKTFFGNFKEVWWSVAGTLVLMVLFVRRFVKGCDALMVLVGVMLWAIQILSLRPEGAEVFTLVRQYPLGVIGGILVAISVLADVYVTKTSEKQDTDVVNKE